MQEDKIALVLCHTFLNNAFRSGQYSDFDSEHFKKFVNSKFIADFIITHSADLPEGEHFAFTSKRIFDNLEDKILSEKNSSITYEYLVILKNTIYQVPNDSVNKLEENEGIFTISDILATRGNYETILVSDMPKKIELAKKFYEENGITNPKLPYSIYSSDETITFLKGRFPQKFEEVKNKDSLYNII